MFRTWIRSQVTTMSSLISTQVSTSRKVWLRQIGYYIEEIDNLWYWVNITDAIFVCLDIFRSWSRSSQGRYKSWRNWIYTKPQTRYQKVLCKRCKYILVSIFYISGARSLAYTKFVHIWIVPIGNVWFYWSTRLSVVLLCRGFGQIASGIVMDWPENIYHIILDFLIA